MDLASLFQLRKYRREEDQSFPTKLGLTSKLAKQCNDKTGGDIPLPPNQLIESVGGACVSNFLLVGKEWANLVLKYLPDQGGSVLDIGCGCGKTTRHFLKNEKIERYVGFDVMKTTIEWCQRYLKPVRPKSFKFYHANIYSAAYNIKGRVLPVRYKFPVGKHSIDLCFAASLFTHLEVDTMERYFLECKRVLKPGGALVCSIHTEVSEEEQFKGSAWRADINPDFFVKLASQSGLSLKKEIGEICGQMGFVFTS